MATIAVAGAAGFIGSHIVEVLIAEGHKVRAIDRPGSDLSISEAAGAKVMEVDLFDTEAGKKAFSRHAGVVDSTGLFHLGASSKDLDRVNVTLTDRIMQAACAAKVKRVVHVSSVAVYGAPLRLPAMESDPLRPRINYEKSKLDGEAVAMRYRNDIEVAVLRPTLVYGPRSRYAHAMLIGTTAQMRALGMRKFPMLRGGPRGHHVHVEDVARAAALLLTHPDAAGRAYNVADDMPTSLGDTMCCIAESMGLEIKGGKTASPEVWKILRLLVKLVPESAIEKLNAQLERGHRALVRQGQNPVLQASVERDWIAYFTEEYEYDTTRLRALGFKCKYPDSHKAMPGVIEWYRQAGWLPEPRAKADRVA